MRATSPSLFPSLFLASSVACAAAACAVACTTTETVYETVPAADAGSGPSNTDDLDSGASTGDGAVATDAAHAHPTPPPLPVIPNQGGPILASPEVITVTWTGDPLVSALETFDGWWVTSATWKTIMAEWGVGPGNYVGAVHLAGAAPQTLGNDDVDALLRAGFTAGTIPPPNGKRLYMIYPPSGTDVTNFGSKGCETFQAYHLSVDVAASDAGAATKAYYAVTPRCANTEGMSPIDFVTWGASHEVMEAASDPQFDHPAWRIDVQSPATPELGENADLCAGHPTVVEGHMITRNWSNVAAKAGERPCVPAPPGPMFGLFPDSAEVTLTPGKSSTLKIHAYASGAIAPFKVGVFPGDPTLTASLSAKTANDGDELTLTINPSAQFVEQLGSNLVYLYAQSSDYSTKRHVIVHSK